MEEIVLLCFVKYKDSQIRLSVILQDRIVWIYLISWLLISII